MKIACVLMCGGKGTRLQQSNKKVQIEKPLLNFRGKPLIEYSIEALLNADPQIAIFAATSNNTPKTRKFLFNKYPNIVSLLETSGKGYAEDYLEILKYFRNKLFYEKNVKSACTYDIPLKYKILFLPIDIPLLTSKTINEITCLESNNPCITVISKKEHYLQYSLTPSFTTKIDGKEYCYTGISIINMGIIGWNQWPEKIKEELIIIDDKEVVFNINTVNDLEKALEYYDSKEI